MQSPRTRSFWLAGLVFLLVAATTYAEESPRKAVAEALAHPINGPEQTMADVQAFAEVRIPGMPEVRSAEEWAEEADRYREAVFSEVIYRGQAADWRDAETRVEWLETIEGGPGYRIKKLRYEALPGLWIPALLYEPENLEGKVPVVLNVNGHDSAGKAADYKQLRCINQAKRGMLALNLEWLGMGQLRGPGYRHGLINAIDLCGSGGIATHYLAMKRALDLMLDLEHADPERVAVTGLSGGGWQTIFFSALETRVKLSNPVAGYSSFKTRARYLSDLGDSEQTPSDLATVVDYNHLTAMLAPRPTLLTFNAKDACCFASGHALPPLLEAASPIFRLFDKGANLRHHINEDPGTHNFELDNRQALYRILADHFGQDDRSRQVEEIPSEDELKTAEELEVPLPADNLDFHQIALQLSQDLPRVNPRPEDDEAAEKWKQDRRLKLRALIRPHDDVVEAEEVGESERDGLSATFWKFRIGAAWSVPAVELSREGTDKGTAILLADSGRKSAEARILALLEEGYRVLAVDPFYFGESEVAERAYLFALLLGTIGERPIGVQSGQVIAIARWMLDRYPDKPVQLVAEGPRTGLIALLATALEPEAIGSVTLHDPPGTLKHDVIEAGVVYSDRPEVFCFGLLESFDVPEIAALVSPRPIQLEAPSDAAKAAFSGLDSSTQTPEP